MAGDAATCGLVAGSGSYSDQVGDGAFSFMDIVGTNVTVSNTSINVEISLADIPSSLTFDSLNMPVNAEEYLWQARFDANDDGMKAGDLLFTVSNYRFEEDVESQGALISDYTQADVWLEGGNGEATVIAHIENASVSGNTLSLSISKDLNLAPPEL